jgi:PAS domain S-box-containing protein
VPRTAGEPHPDLFQAVFEGSPVGVGVFDEQGRYVQVNPALEAIVGLPASELLGRRVQDVFGGVGARAGRMIKQVLRTGKPVLNRSLRGPTGAGESDRWFLASYFRLGENGAARVASLIVDVTDEQRIREALQRANDRLVMLGQASAVLSASLDLQETLAALADLVVPRLADHCVVDLIDDAGQVRRRAVSSAPGAEPPPGVWAEPGEVVSYGAAHPVRQVLRTGRPVLLSGDPREYDFEAAAPSAVSAEFARSVGLRAALTLPLTARGQQVGVLSFGMSTSGRGFAAEDQAVAEQLAARAAVAIDNALLFQRQQRVALTLQRELLPERLPHAEGLQAAASYLPAAGGQVGGDWYDLVELAASRVAIVVGDVMGRGLHAAALMGQLRAAIRGYAMQDLPPAEVLRYLNELVRGLDESTIVTCVYAVYDAAEDRLCLAGAGHPPPLLLDPSGVRPIELSGPPLGAATESYPHVEIPFGGASTLVLYTDGLVETRGADLDVGIGRLIEALTPPPERVEEVPARALAILHDADGHLDDVALLAVRPFTPAAPELARVALSGSPSAPGEARSFTQGAGEAWGLPPELLESAMLVASELVTNAVVHGVGELELRLHRSTRKLCLEVVDASGRMPQHRPAVLHREDGREIDLVDALSVRWGARTLSEFGRIVWCELALPGRSAGPGS